MSTESVLASVAARPGVSEVREFPFPRIADDAGLLRVEAAGVCGTDVASYARGGEARILGHENVGRIAALGDVARRRWGVEVGDRVALEEYLPCGHCSVCRTDDFRLCRATDSRAGGIRYGSTGINVAPALWGGYSQYMYLHPNSVLHRVPEDVPAQLLSLAIPISNGYEWACIEGAAGVGRSVLVIGPGQQGLACVLAARSAGAEAITVLGLPRDAKRLEVARAFGANIAIALDPENPREAVRNATGEATFDLVIDAARGDSGTLATAIDFVGRRGTILISTAAESVDAVALKALQWKCASIRGVRGHSFAAVEWALDLIATGRFPLELMATDVFGLSAVDSAIRATGGELGPETVHVTVDPWLQDDFPNGSRSNA